ncbi:MAG: aspartate--tRNA ligase, partial [Candidatus Andersenbacteria bacterium]|nr:aspartate--tRNA ligase [Candidatus Andersenbacteria bacterium]
RAAATLGRVRTAVAEKMHLADPAKAAWVWVTDFPMYEYNEAAGKIDFSHNPFSMPQGGLSALDAPDPTTILGYQYDLALNGYEISSGAIRNHRPDIMYRAFAIAGYSQKEVDKKFGGLLRAFSFGAPPHGGLAPGLDRLLFILQDEANIREIYAFPKDGRARDLMMDAPSNVTAQQLKELHLHLDQPH